MQFLSTLFKRSTPAKPLNELTSITPDAHLTAGLALHMTRDSAPQSSSVPTMAQLEEAIERMYTVEDVRLFAEMAELMLETHPQVHSVAQIRRAGVSGQQLFVSDTKNPEIAEACEKLLKSVCVRKALDHLHIGGLWYGLAAVEFQWAYDDVQGLHISDYMPVSPRALTFCPYTREPMLLGATHGEAPLLLASRGAQFVVHAPRKADSVPYMLGLAFKLLPYLAVTPYGIRMLVKLLSRYGSPIAIGVMQDASGMNTETYAKKRKSLLQAVKDIAGFGGGVMEAGQDMRLVEAVKADGVLHERAMKLINELITKSWLGGTLTAGTSGDSNTNALGEVHDKVRGDLSKGDAEDLAQTLKEQILRPFVRGTFGESAEVPDVYFEQVSNSALEYTPQLISLMNAGLRIPASVFYDAYGIPAPEGSEDEVIGGGQAAGAVGGVPALFSQNAYTSSFSNAPASQGDEIDQLAEYVDVDELRRAMVREIGKGGSLVEIQERLKNFVEHADEHCPGVVNRIASAHVQACCAGAAEHVLTGEQ